MIYPNPFTTDISLQITEEQSYIAERVHIYLYDVSGREVMSYVVTDGNQRSINIDTKVLPAGIYFVDVQAGTTRTIHKVTKIN
jgi:hypothetical protein